MDYNPRKARIMEGYHKSVLLDEVIDALNIRDAWYLDATLGDGGHSIEIIKRGGKVIGVDQDPQSLKRVQKRFEELGINKSSYLLVRGNFRDLLNLIKKQTDIADLKLAGVIFDLGVSSLQFETPERGFSFGKSGPLDMRMDPDLGVTALDLINLGGRKELSEIFKKFGDEKNSYALADAIVRAREVGRIETTDDLARIAEKVLGRKGKIPAYAKALAGRHPATKMFQALRIVVNDELEALKEGLDQVKDLIEKNGSIAVISFHSGEDRIVKSMFKEWEFKGLGRILTKKPVVSSDEEIASNPRARSAKMRIFKRL